MIYLLHFENSDGGFRDEHRYGQCLLTYALFREKKLRLSEQMIVRNKWGKPSLRDFPDVQFNVSHCRGLAACVLGKVPVGIDVEEIRAFSPYAARHVCSRHELDDIMRAKDPDRQFFIYWTLKESCVKAMGTGLSYPLKNLVFQITEQDIVCKTQSEYLFFLLKNTGRYITSICYKRDGYPARICE